jgi:purine-nucleoside phosphorylase
MNKRILKEMVNYVLSSGANPGKIAVILGSGLGEFADVLINPTVISYTSIPNYPKPTVEGHIGRLVLGEYNHIPITVAQGRFHYYEGYGLDKVTIPVQLFAGLGIKTIIITNAAGSCREDIPPGSLMLIKGHMDCTFRNAVTAPDLVNKKPYYDEIVLKNVVSTANAINIPIQEGIYCWTLGPAYETPAEISYLMKLGGDAVGMSTVPEIEQASNLGVKVIGISAITNYAAGITKQPLTHDEVIKTADDVKYNFINLVGGLIEKFGDQ